MRLLLALLAALAVTLLLSQGQAQAPADLVVEGDDNGSAFWFTVQGMEGRNPILMFEPGQNVSITFRNVGDTVHNLVFGEPINQATELIRPNEFRTLNFTVPDVDYALGEYWCDPHRLQGMAGDMVIGEEPAAAPESGIPGFLLLGSLAAAGVAAWVLRR